jgi:hypothetical protein
MPVMQDRRRFLATLSSTAAAGLLHVPNVLGQEAPLETTRIRLYDWTGLCIAPQFVAEELLNAEGFTDVQYVRAEPTGQLPNPLLASGAVDINSQISCDIGVRKKPSVARGPKLIMETKQPHSTITSGVRQPIVEAFEGRGNEMAMTRQPYRERASETSRLESERNIASRKNA